jgi:hypothetical protein
VFSPDGTLLAAVKGPADPDVGLFDRDGRLLVSLPVGLGVRRLVFTPDGSRLAALTTHHELRVFSAP